MVRCLLGIATIGLLVATASWGYAASNAEKEAAMGPAGSSRPETSVPRLLAYAVQTITSRQILPSAEPPDSTSTVISVRACAGEYEPASFVVHALEDSVTLEVEVTEMEGRAGALPADTVDVRTVKCWYQAGPTVGDLWAPLNEGVRLLTPELLLKDDDLIKLDHEQKENYVKLVFPDGRVDWLWISNPDEPNENASNIPLEERPIRDAKTLQPVAIPQNTAKQFWITVHVPEEAQPGEYQGEIELRSEGDVLGTLSLELEVLPFPLEPNPLETSIYFHWDGGLNPEDAGSVNTTRRSAAQYQAELENLLAHGVDNPTVAVPFDTGILPTELTLRQAAGMRNDYLYYLNADTRTSTEEIKEIIEIAKGFGFSEVYFYGNDEARGEALTSQRANWERVHDAGGKIFVAGAKDVNFPAMGDLQDLLVCGGEPSREEAALWHGNGHKIFAYLNPQSGIEDPEIYRRNFGLLLAMNDYDGAMDYEYYEGWNDFNIKPYRQHNFIYPTVDGVIDTIQWEGYREGVDDLRYLATLQKAIAEAEEAGKSEADGARAFIENLDLSGDLDAIRDKMIDWILKLRSADKDLGTSPAA